MSKSPDYREIYGCKKENGKIIGVYFKRMSNMTSDYLTLKQIYEEQFAFENDVRRGVKDRIENTIYTLKYLDEEDGGGVAKFVIVAKFGDQYEIRDVKDKLIQTLQNLADPTTENTL